VASTLHQLSAVLQQVVVVAAAVVVVHNRPDV
jgi:hypothetical protein